MTKHIALLGDSIFDNAAYTAGAPDVASHLRAILPVDWSVTLCAVDGTTTHDLGEQFHRVPAKVSHVFVSVGGNNALLNSDLLATAVASTAEALELFATRVDQFERDYVAALAGLGENLAKTTICTIYNGNLPEVDRTKARIALMMFNDVIIRAGLRLGLNVLDLRGVCSDRTDYANPIEPSGSGGAKIAQALAAMISARVANRPRVTLGAG